VEDGPQAPQPLIPRRWGPGIGGTASTRLAIIGTALVVVTVTVIAQVGLISPQFRVGGGGGGSGLSGSFSEAFVSNDSVRSWTVTGVSVRVPRAWAVQKVAYFADHGLRRFEQQEGNGSRHSDLFVGLPLTPRPVPIAPGNELVVMVGYEAPTSCPRGKTWGTFTSQRGQVVIAVDTPLGLRHVRVPLELNSPLCRA
jgi:hypothetical protein